MEFLKRFWTSRVSFHHSDDTVLLRDHANRPIALSDLCKRLTPLYLPSFLLCNGHLQTIWTARKNSELAVRYKRQIFESENDLYPGTFSVDFVVHGEENVEEDPSLPPLTTYFNDGELMGSTDNKPMLITLHGVSGGSHEPYIKHALAPLVDGGWEACVVISRGCGKTKLTSSMLYNARSTWDLRQTVGFLRRKYPNRPLYALGFSIGANILVNYLGEEGADCGIRAAVVCSNPWNLEVVDLALKRSWMGLNVYSHAMANGMKEIVQRHAEIILRNRKIAAAAIEKIRYFFDFDSAIQLPMWGYPTRGAYYRDASSVDAVLAVRIPLFAINAEDDPISHYEALPFEEFRNNPFTVLCTTSTGGHLGWFESGDRRWFTKPVISFLNVLHADIDWSRTRKFMSRNEKQSHFLEYHPVRRRLQPAAPTYFPGQAEPV